MRRTSFDTRKIIQLALFTALVVVVQCIPISIAGVEIAVSVPVVVIGAAICGPLAGAWLGLAFAVVVLLLPGTSSFYLISIVGTLVTVIVKGVAAGLVAGVVYKVFEWKNRYLAAMISAVLATVTNTAVFILGSLLFFEGDIAELIRMFVATNFLIEIVINITLVPTITRIISIKRR